MMAMEKGKQAKKWTEDMMDDCLKSLPKICTTCGVEGGHIFLQMANNSSSQPRYKCGSCKSTFTHNGRRNSKNKANMNNCSANGVRRVPIKKKAMKNVKNNIKLQKIIVKDNIELHDSKLIMKELAKFKEPIQIIEGLVVNAARVGSRWMEEVPSHPFPLKQNTDWKLMTEEEKKVADTTGENYNYSEVYYHVTKCGYGFFFEMMVDVEYVDEEEAEDENVESSLTSNELDVGSIQPKEINTLLSEVEHIFYAP